MSTFVIINPAAGGGRVVRQWRRLEGALRVCIGSFEHRQTAAGQGAQALAAEAAQAGFTRIIAVGGDGTINEVVNALASTAREKTIAPALGIIPLGTGNDIARNLGLFSPHLALQALHVEKLRHIDLGRISFSGADGKKQSRDFINVASMGLIGEVVKAAQGSTLKRVLGSRLAYPLHTIAVLRWYGGHAIEIELEDGSVRRAEILAVVAANGRFFGAGMKVAPNASFDDGLLDILVAETSPKFRALDLRLLYSGKHLDHPAISHFKARRVRFSTVDGRKMLCETDGELQGHGPCEIEVMPRRLKVIA